MFTNYKKYTNCIRCGGFRKAYYSRTDFDEWPVKTKLCNLCFQFLTKNHGIKTIENAIFDMEYKAIKTFDKKLKVKK